MCEAAQSPRLLIVRPQSSLSSTDSKLVSRDPPREKCDSPSPVLKKLRQSFGVQPPKPVDVALSLIPQVRVLESCYQSFWESFTSTLESNCQVARRLAHFASRNIHREVHPALKRTASEPTADAVEVGSLCVRK